MRIMTNKEMELSIARMLRVGVILSASLVFLGGVLYLQHPLLKTPVYERFVPESEPLRDIPGVLRGVLHLEAKSIIEFGILLLIATPIARVAFCIVGFARQRDGLYVLISMSVFAILIYSLIQGGR